MSELETPQREGREGDFIRLLVAGQPRMFGYLVTLLSSLHEAEEVLQETSIVMWEKFGEFALPDPASESTVDEFVAWGNRIAYLKVLNLRRKKKIVSGLQSEHLVQLVSEEWTRLEQSTVLQSRREALKQCIERLPEKHRDVLNHYYWQKLSVDRIAERTSRTRASVYKSLQRIRDTLHRCISATLADER